MAKAPVRHSLCSFARANRAKLIHNSSHASPHWQEAAPVSAMPAMLCSQTRVEATPSFALWCSTLQVREMYNVLFPKGALAGPRKKNGFTLRILSVLFFLAFFYSASNVGFLATSPMINSLPLYRNAPSILITTQACL